MVPQSPIGILNSVYIQPSYLLATIYYHPTAVLVSILCSTVPETLESYIREQNINNNNIMSSETASSICANCGKEGSDVTNRCNKCKSVMYCNAACKKKHRKKHKKECERRVAELHDEKLFKQPPPKEDCSICFLRLPTLGSDSTYMACCGKLICTGCVRAFRSKVTKRKDDICPFCRTPPPKSNEEFINMHEKRAEMNDAQAIQSLGAYYSHGMFGLQQDYTKALELWHRAADLGHADAYNRIGDAYAFGRGRMEINRKKAMYYFEQSAVRGDPAARCNLGEIEEEAGNTDRALKHYMIAVKDGNSASLEKIKSLHLEGRATKDVYANALRSYQVYVDEIKSDQRIGQHSTG